MGAYIKFDGVGSNSFFKIEWDEIKGSGPKPNGWSQNSRAKLASMGLSPAGIQALMAGQPVQSPVDQKIVAAILQAVVK